MTLINLIKENLHLVLWISGVFVLAVAGGFYYLRRKEEQTALAAADPLPHREAEERYLRWANRSLFAGIIFVLVGFGFWVGPVRSRAGAGGGLPPDLAIARAETPTPVGVPPLTPTGIPTVGLSGFAPGITRTQTVLPTVMAVTATSTITEVATLAVTPLPTPTIVITAAGGTPSPIPTTPVAVTATVTPEITLAAAALKDCRFLPTGKGNTAALSEEVGDGEVALIFGWRIESLHTGDGPWYFRYGEAGALSVVVTDGALCIGGEEDISRIEDSLRVTHQEWQEADPNFSLPKLPYEAPVTLWDTMYCRIYQKTGEGKFGELAGEVLGGEIGIVDAWNILSLDTVDGPWFYVRRETGAVSFVVQSGALCIGPEAISLPSRRQACPICEEWDP